MRCLVGRAPFSYPFGKKGRSWLAGLELPAEERETVDAGIRQIEFLDSEIEAVEQLIASEALDSAEIRRLMSVPGVNVICAATFLAAIGKQGSGAVRHALVEASWSVVRQPGPIRAFYQRVRARRGHQVAITAAARKLACLFWCLLTRGEDYAFAQPSLTQKKLRLLEIRAGAKALKGTPTGTWATRQKMRDAERELANQAEAAYRRSVRDRHATGDPAWHRFSVPP
jgi:transposase